MKKSLIALVPFVVLIWAALVFKQTEVSPLLPQEDLSVSFVSYMSQVKGVQRIQLVDVTSVEVIERTSKYSLFWNTFKLPDVVVLARIPTTYSYSVDLKKPFKISISDDFLLIEAPPLEAGPPAPDISAISYEVKEGSVFRDTGKAFEELRKTITPLLKEKADLNKAQVIPEAERQLGSLVRAWIQNTQPDLKLPEKASVRFDLNVSSP